MSITHESAFEAGIESDLLSDGWAKVDPSGYDRAAGLFPDEVVAFVQASQPKAWEQLVTRHGGEQSARIRFLKTVADAIDHRGTVSVLRAPVKDTGVSVRLCFFKPASGLNEEQSRRYGANRLGVVRQLHHSESNTMASVDLALVVNGIPVATAELKNPLTGQGIEQAMTQYRTDRNRHDLIFRARTLVHFAVDPHRVAMTTRLAGQDTRFLPFDQGSAGPGHPGTAGNPGVSGGYQTAYLWRQVWQRDAWLDLLGSFVHAEDGGRILFPRYHQWHAVRSIIDATVRDGAGVDRLVQHSAGSGKSNTIAWTAHALSRLHGSDDVPIFDKVVVLTDRTVLDRQLQQTVAGLDHTPGTIVRIDQKSQQLKEALEGNAARVIITTLQKFPVVAKLAAEAEAAGEATGVVGRRFAVIVDEAHSSTTGDSVTKLKTVLSGEDALEAAEAEQAEAEEGQAPDEALLASAAARGKRKNLSFFAFTATPKPRTLETFGQADGEGHKRPFHTYSMRQAIAEGFILDVLAGYTTYSVYYKLANAHPRNDPEFESSKGRAALARFASLHPYQLEAKAEVIIEHFRAKTAKKIDGQAKAMVVTRSRLHAVRMKQALDAYIARKGYGDGESPLRTLVAFSGPLNDPDDPGATPWTEANLNGFSEGQLPKRFREDGYQLLVVAEKYQTGFDEPLLHTMYVDKKLAGVAAVQALSRLNRTRPGKEDTFVLDFANTTEEIKAAFEPFYEESFAAPTEPNVLYTMEHDLMAAGVLSREEMDAAVTALLRGDATEQSVIYANLGPAVGRFVSLDEDGQESFRGTLQSFVRAYAFVAQVMPFTDTDLERMFLYGRLLLSDLPARDNDPMPQLSKSVHLTHLKLSVTAHEEAIELVGSDQAGTALPGEGKGAVTEPVLDKLSALIEAMNEKYGADLTDADKVWVDQQWAVVKDDAEMEAVAVNNDRSQYEMVLEQKVKDLLLDRHEKNGVLFDMFFANPDFQTMLLNYLGGTYDEFRRDARAQKS
ncbi:type I restriction endonuclease subunit R [Phycicoccus sp. CSK15P-2]|uniref:type I restriction endonuclease subunit R n=1 Tax=Phycicoccus sp. CSK15P-2 TaxID=2807627 RepID=UPI00194F8ED7|nr:type I restriction endonuclease [Phycicoccus sp. CSK15P-2]MBM6404622.1 type I restriction endonuclease subunit R [Phycicoccus sp. CSK15P-2]